MRIYLILEKKLKKVKKTLDLYWLLYLSLGVR